MTSIEEARAKLQALSEKHSEEEIKTLLEREIQLDKLILSSLTKAELLKEPPASKEQKSPSENTGKLAIMEEVHAYLTEHFTEPFQTTELAERFHISRSYMMHAFKDKYYVSIHEYLILLRVSQAKRSLLVTDATVTEIADQCGFHTLSYFVKIFREREGVTPTEYREKCRKNITLTGSPSAPFQYQAKNRMEPVLKIRGKEPT